MVEFFRKFFRKLFKSRSGSSASEAKKRIISVLIHDRTDISHTLLENLRVEMIALLKKYMDIDESNIEISLDRGSRAVSLVANVPVLRVKRGTAGLSETNSPELGREAKTEPHRNHNKNRRNR
jgi:cell division topological specificity factor